MNRTLLTGLLAASLAGCLQTADTYPSRNNTTGHNAAIHIDTRPLTGTAFYRERLLLPQTTEIEVTVYDANGSTLAQHREPAPAGPPYNFSSRVPSVAMNSALSVQIRLLVEGRTRFISNRTPVDHNQPLRILLSATDRNP